MPQALQVGLIGDPETDRWAGFTAATMLARHGFQVLPSEPGGKAPLTLDAFRHGAKSATTDPERVRDAWLMEPAANVSMAPDGQYVIADIDPRKGGSLERAEAQGLPVDGYRERSGGGGWHIPLVMPIGMLAVHSTDLIPGVGIRAKGAYAVSPVSRLADGGQYVPEPNRDVWFWPVIPADRPWLEQLAAAPTSAPYYVQGRDDQAAQALMAALLASSEASTVRACLAAPVGRRSEADFALVIIAARQLSDQPRRAAILTALLLHYSAKSRDHRRPTQYASITVANALAAPVPGLPAVDRLQTIQDRLATGLTRLPLRIPTPPTCDDATRLLDDDITDGLIGWLNGVEANDPWAGEGDWVRVPVEDLATVLGASTRTLQRRMAVLEAIGQIKRSVIRTKRGGLYRADSWARFTGTGAVDGTKARSELQ